MSLKEILKMKLPFTRKGLEDYLEEHWDKYANDLQQVVNTQINIQMETIFALLKAEINSQLSQGINNLRRTIEVQNMAQAEKLFDQLKEEINLQLHRRINELQQAMMAQNTNQAEILFAQLKEEMNLQLHRRINDLQSTVIKDIRDMHGDLYGYFGRFPKMLSFEVPLADHCNLNCVGCSHFSPLSPPNFMDLDTFTCDFKRMSELLEAHTHQIRLMGGEPLLNHDINKYLVVARQYFPHADILVVTNGLLLPKMEEPFWETCRENQIVIAPTKYPVNFDYDAAEKLVEAHGVKYRYFSDRDAVGVFEKYALDPQGLQDYEQNYRMCSIPNPCPHLRNGRLYLCPIPPTVRYLNESFGTHFEESPQDFIDIHQAKSAEEILEFLAKPIPFCRYCRKDVTEEVPWRQSQHELSEWTL